MAAGIRGSEAVLMILFKGTLNRPYCRFEMRLARAYGVPVIVILEGEHYRETYVSICDVSKQFDDGSLPSDLECVVETADFNFFYRRQEHEVEGMLNRLCEKIDESQAEGKWPLNRESKSKELIRTEAAQAYKLLDAEVRGPSQTRSLATDQVMEDALQAGTKRSLSDSGKGSSQACTSKRTRTTPEGRPQVTFMIREDSGSDCNFRNVQSYDDLVTKIRSRSGFERSDSLELEYMADSRWIALTSEIDLDSMLAP